MIRRAPAILALLLYAASPAPAQVNPSIFPPATPGEVGLSSAKLREAMDTIGGWVEQRRIQGGILIVIREGRLAWHEAVGWNDRERGVPLQKDDILLMRSMTKPLTGAGILMLMEEGRLSLDDSASKYLPGWDGAVTREITIRQLLTHTSGISGGLPSGHATQLDAVAAKGRSGPLFPPGSRYRYADANSSALAAIITVVSGTLADDFLRERILEPLGMKDSYLVHVDHEDPRRARTAAGYRGSSETGEWNRYRDRTSGPLTAWFGGSGGLFATGLDYARFLRAFMLGGELHGARLLRAETVALALEPHTRGVYTGSDLMAMTRLYGLHWYAWTDRYGVNPWPFPPRSFGHGGAEGTFAWADPVNDLIVLYLTQSNGNDTRQAVPRMIYEAIVR
jgi:CubicO group peptidase (beta-lactamase class C family)